MAENVVENVQNGDRRRKRRCSNAWQTVLFIIFLTAGPSLLLTGALITSDYEKYIDDFVPLNCNIEGSYAEVVDNVDRVSINVNYTYNGNIGYRVILYESYSSALDAKIISEHLTQYIDNITCYWNSENGLPVVKIPDTVEFYKNAKALGLGLLITGAGCIFFAIVLTIPMYIRDRRELRERANQNAVITQPPILTGRR